MSNVLIVYKEEYPWDVRVEKLALTLSEHHDTHILCRNNTAKPQLQQRDDYTIHRIPGMRWLPAPLKKAFQYSFWFNPIWMLSLVSCMRKNRIEVLIVRDLPLLPLGIFASKFLGVPLIYDMAECYPLMYESTAQFTKSNFFIRVVKNPRLAAVLERYCLNRAHATWTMIEESRDRAKKITRFPERIGIVSNTPVTLPAKVQADHTGEEIRIAYVGFITKIRGLDLLIRGIAEFRKHKQGGDKIRFDIVGKGDYRDNLISLVRDLELEDVIHIHGWLDKDQVEKIIAGANVGALTYRVCSHWNHTIPNKIFDYMKEGKPVIATPVAPIARILREEKCGVVSDGTPKGICDKLIRLKSDVLRTELGSNGMSAILKRYNWDLDSKILNQVVDSLI